MFSLLSLFLDIDNPPSLPDEHFKGTFGDKNYKRRLDSTAKETPMKPSQVHNKLPHPPSRRMLPLQSSELYQGDRLSLPQYSLLPVGTRPGFIPVSPVNIASSGNKVCLTPRDKSGHVPHSARPPGSSCSTPVSVSSANTIDASAKRSQHLLPTNFSPKSPPCMKDLSNQSLTSHIKKKWVTKSEVTLFHSGSNNVTPPRPETREKNVQSSHISSSVNLVQLHSQPVASSLNTKAAQEACPPLHSDSDSTDNNSKGCQPFSSTQPTPTRENKNAAVDLKKISQKRSRETENFDDGNKKPCVQHERLGKAQTPKPTTSLIPQPLSGHSSVSAMSPKTPESHLCSEPTFGELTHMESSTASSQLSCTSVAADSCIKKRASMGAKQVFVKPSISHTVKLAESPGPGEEYSKRKSEEINKGPKRGSGLSPEGAQKDSGKSAYFQSHSQKSGQTYSNTLVLPAKTLSRTNQVEESRKLDSGVPKQSSKTNLSSPNSCATEPNRTIRKRRSVTIPDNINELFTPDPTYVVVDGQKIAKPTIIRETIKPTVKEKNSLTSGVPTSSSTGSLCRKSQSVTVCGFAPALDRKVSTLSSEGQTPIFLPTLTLEHVKIKGAKSSCSSDNNLKNSPEVTSSGKVLQDEGVKSDGKKTSVPLNDVKPCALETDNAGSQKMPTVPSSHSSLLKRQASERERKQMDDRDPLDVEFDLGLSFALDLDLSQSSQSSDEEELLSLQEMMERAAHPPDTPEKGAFSEPSTPGHQGSLPKTQPLPSAKPANYKNSLDQMLKEIKTNKRAKEIETQLLTACKEDLLKIAEFEEAEENREEASNNEHQEFLQRFSLMSSALREVPPGEVVFNLDKFGCIFNHDTLQLKKYMINSQGAAQKTLLMSSPAQLKLHINIGTFQEVYDSHLPCPAQVTRFLFKMMSVHNERLVSKKILQALCDIACTAACQIVKNGNQLFKVWVPSLADVALVLMNMGAAFVTLFPFENLQPSFSEGDLLGDTYIKSESSSKTEQSTFPEYNYNNVLKYLCYSMALCPRAYTDDELLLLLTVLGKVSLDTCLVLQTSVELYPLLCTIVCNIRDWDTMPARICQALTDLTEDHHNMCLLVQLLPHNTRGKRLRQHLSLCMISKLLDGKCTYTPTENEIQLSDLRVYLHRMRPSSLLESMLSSSSSTRTDREDMNNLDQQSYYLCYSLLTLANEASNFQSFQVPQKEQLLRLCSELETHVKCDIRESEKCLYRSKVKDLVARIYTKWQILLQRTRPLHGQLYDYWKPADTLTISQGEQEMVSSEEEEEPAVRGDEEEEEEEEEEGEEEEEEISVTEENDADMVSEDDEKEDTNRRLDKSNDTVDETKPEGEPEGENIMDDSDERNKERTKLVQSELNFRMPEMEHRPYRGAEVAQSIEEEIETGHNA